MPKAVIFNYLLITFEKKKFPSNVLRFGEIAGRQRVCLGMEGGGGGGGWGKSEEHYHPFLCHEVCTTEMFTNTCLERK